PRTKGREPRVENQGVRAGNRSTIGSRFSARRSTRGPVAPTRPGTDRRSGLDSRPSALGLPTLSVRPIPSGPRPRRAPPCRAGRESRQFHTARPRPPRGLFHPTGWSDEAGALPYPRPERPGLRLRSDGRRRVLRRAGDGGLAEPPREARPGRDLRPVGLDAG